MGAGRIVSIQTTEERGGAEYANVEMLEGLRRRGHLVSLLTDMPEIASGTDVPVRAIDLGPKLSHRSVGRTALAAPLTVWRLARALRAARPVAATLVHFKKEQLLCSLLPTRLTGAIVWAEWGPVPLRMRHGLPRLIYAGAARRTRGVLAVSEGTKATVIAAGVPASKVIVAPNLFDGDAIRFDPSARDSLRAQWGVADGTFVVGCISRFQRRKRNDVVIDAMKHLDGEVLLIMAGEGEEEASLRARAAPLGPRIRFVSNVRGRAAAILSACDVAVFAPSPTEGAPRVVVEAQLVGRPVVATDEQGARELLAPGTGAIVSPANDARALADVLAGYRDDPDRRRREGAAARTAAVERHDPARTLRMIERVLGIDPRAPSVCRPSDS